MCVCKVFTKTWFFCGLYKKIKFILWKALFSSSNFAFFYIDHTIRRFFLKRLCGNIACQDVRVNFLFQIFLTFKTYRRCISNKMEHMLTQKYKTTSRSMDHLTTTTAIKAGHQCTGVTACLPESVVWNVFMQVPLRTNALELKSPPLKF
jgi:hypothetical protein